MDIQQFLEKLADRVSASASVKNVYGEPVAVANRTVIPIARVRHALGGGGGAKGVESHSGGGGGKMSAEPCGALEVTPEGTRYVALHDWRVTGIVLGVGFALGVALAMLKNRD